MSQANVEIVRPALLASSGGDFSVFVARSDPSVEWDMSGVTGCVEQEIIEACRRCWDYWRLGGNRGRGGISRSRKSARGWKARCSPESMRWLRVQLPA